MTSEISEYQASHESPEKSGKKRKITDECLDDWLKELWDQAPDGNQEEDVGDLVPRSPKFKKILTYEDFNQGNYENEMDFEFEFNHELLDT